MNFGNGEDRWRRYHQELNANTLHADCQTFHGRIVGGSVEKSAPRLGVSVSHTA